MNTKPYRILHKHTSIHTSYKGISYDGPHLFRLRLDLVQPNLGLRQHDPLPRAAAPLLDLRARVPPPPPTAAVAATAVLLLVPVLVPAVPAAAAATARVRGRRWWSWTGRLRGRVSGVDVVVLVGLSVAILHTGNECGWDTGWGIIIRRSLHAR